MDQSPAECLNIGHSFYCKCIQDDENMKARIKTILNKIHENREAVKELHIEYGTKFSEINSYINKLENISEHYDGLIRELVERRETLLNMCNEAVNK